MRLLLIHDADELRARVAETLMTGLPDLQLELWDPSRQGAPEADYCCRFDALLLDEYPADADGIEWLQGWQRARSGASWPPTLVLSSGTSDARAAAAKRAGARDYLRKVDLSPERIVAAARVNVTRPPDATVPLRADPASIPEPIAGYDILRLIAQGGMSRVYLARRQSDGLELVLKVLDRSLHRDASFRQRFVHEYSILRRLSHPNVVTIFDQAMNDRYGYIAMEYFPAGTLKERIRGEPLPTDTVQLCLTQIARALEAVHGAGVVHRDLKPHNIMFRNDLELAILDFGLARDTSVNVNLTQLGVVLATPMYMSPEQCKGLPHDARGDLYSVGAILHEMLTGKPPYSAGNAADMAFQHVHGPLPKLPAVLTHRWEPIVHRLLAKKPEDRVQSARALLTLIGQS
jgi:serine/threonine protein kinase